MIFNSGGSTHLKYGCLSVNIIINIHIKKYFYTNFFYSYNNLDISIIIFFTARAVHRNPTYNVAMPLIFKPIYYT